MSVKDFFQAAVSDKPTSAYKAFSAAIEPKINDALTAREKEVSNQLFNKGSE